MKALSGADVNERSGNEGSESALTVAVRQHDYELIHLLRASGACINQPSHYRYKSALAVAAKNGDIEMARFLLDQGADPDDSGALEGAADESMLDLLFSSYDARYPTSRGCSGASVLARAVVHGNELMVRRMLEKRVNDKEMVIVGDQMATPFGHAIVRQQSNFPGCLELFLQNGCSPNDIVAEACESGTTNLGVKVHIESFEAPRVTALLAAVSTRDISTVMLFLKYGGDVNLPTRGRVKRTPLQRAAEIGSLDMVDFLLNHGANVNAPAAERGGGTALQLAAIGGYIPVACKLLSLKADPNAAKSKVNGRTALEGAAEHGRLDMIQVLLNGGAASRPGDEAQIKSAIALARGERHNPLGDLLESHLKSRTQGSGPELLSDDNKGGPIFFSLEDDTISLVDFEGAGEL